jgi:hypothetical protein
MRSNLGAERREPTKALRKLAGAAVQLLLALAGPVGMMPGSLGAAELPIPAAVRAPAYCGPCGCLGVAYTYHRELQTTHGLGFDPRNYHTHPAALLFG